MHMTMAVALQIFSVSLQWAHKYYSWKPGSLLLQHVYMTWVRLRALRIPTERGKVDSEAHRIPQEGQPEPGRTH